MSSNPKNKILYNRVKREAKTKFKVFPSAYASGWIVREYKKRGGTYSRVNSKRKTSRSRSRSRRNSKSRQRARSRSKSRQRVRSRSKSRQRVRSRSKSRQRSRSRVNSKSPKSGLKRWFAEKWIDVCRLPKKVPCGRSKSRKSNYPYCRPSIRVNKNTPKTIREISKTELKRRCSKKRK